VTHGYDWTFICDDDTYLVPLRLEAAVPDEGIDCFGWRRENGGAVYPDPYPQGSAYWLSKRASAYVSASGHMVYGIPDDVAVGRALKAAGMAILDDHRYFPGPIAISSVPRLDNDIISTHKCLPEEMHRIHDNWIAESGLRCPNPSTFALI